MSFRLHIVPCLCKIGAFVILVAFLLSVAEAEKAQTVGSKTVKFTKEITAKNGEKITLECGIKAVITVIKAKLTKSDKLTACPDKDRTVLLEKRCNDKHVCFVMPPAADLWLDTARWRHCQYGRRPLQIVYSCAPLPGHSDRAKKLGTRSSLVTDILE